MRGLFIGVHSCPISLKNLHQSRGEEGELQTHYYTSFVILTFYPLSEPFTVIIKLTRTLTISNRQSKWLTSVCSSFYFLGSLVQVFGRVSKNFGQSMKNVCVDSANFCASGLDRNSDFSSEATLACQSHLVYGQ